MFLISHLILHKTKCILNGSTKRSNVKHNVQILMFNFH